MVHALPADPTVKIWPLKLEGSHQSLNSPRNVCVSRQEPTTLGTGGLLAGGFPPLGVVGDRLREATGERWAAGQHPLRPLRENRWRAPGMWFLPIAPTAN